MGQARRRGSYEERKAQGAERKKEAERIELDKREAVREQERADRDRANRLLRAKAGAGVHKGKSSALTLLAMMSVIGHT